VPVEDRAPVTQQQITVTGTVQRRAWRDRVLPPVELVRPGLWSVPTPFPRSPLRYVLAYLVETERGPVLVDTGWPSGEAWDGLVAGVAATGHQITDVTAVLVTHFHADHFGLANRVRDVSGAWVGMHPKDAAILSDVSARNGWSAEDRAWLGRRGVPDSELEDLLPPKNFKMPAGARGADVLIEDGDRPLGKDAPLRALWTPGHTPGHLCFADERYDVLLTGDHILPRISPNISPAPGQTDGQTDDALGSYLGSLAALADLDPDEVLPAHEYRFAGLPARVRKLQDHHRARLDEVLAVVAAADGCTTLEVAERLTWSRPWRQSQGLIRRSAIGETYAHLLHLQRRSLLSNTENPHDHWRIAVTTRPEIHN
jgi:glyoxylase-like metal-dependent hydrolase (beta-lactamase superfamily II)